jgi:hypothetical protein
MRVHIRAAAAALTLLLLSLPRAGAAQVDASDSYVLRPGQIRLSAGLRYAGYDERFGASEREPLAAPFLQPLTPSLFAPLQPLGAGLSDFFAATAARPGVEPVDFDAAKLSLGTPEVGLFESVVRTPLELSLGILPRVEIGVSVPFLRGEQMLERFTLADGTVGANPNASGNAAILGGIGAEWEDLGRSDFLPTASSELGMALQARVGALTGGGALDLPTAPGDTALLQSQLVSAYGVPGVRSRVDRIRLGDAQILSRVMLLGNLGAAPVPADSARGVHFRSTLLLGLRLPTGAAPDTVELIPIGYDVGIGGYSAGVVNDLFLGHRFWLTAGVSYASFATSDATRLLAPPAAPLSALGPPVGVRLTPGSELRVRVAPRYRLLEGISIGAEYQLDRVGTGRVEGSGEAAGSAFELAGGTGQRVGAGLRYSTLPAAEEGRSPVPIEIELRYQRSVSGEGGMPAAGYTVAEVRLMPRLWGR